MISDSTPSSEQPVAWNPPRRSPGGFPVIGVVGAGQLARMMIPPAVGLDLGLRIMGESLIDSASLVAADVVSGAHTDLDALRHLAAACDVVTFDHEQVPAHHLQKLASAGVVLRPGPDALRYAQDKVAMRQRLTALALPCPPWREVRTAQEVAAFAEEHGWPVVLKTPRGGYDGRGVAVAESLAQAKPWLDRSAGDSLLAEQCVRFTRELAVLVARSPMGQAASWPVVETVQVGGICTQVIAPAPGISADLAARATSIALQIAGELNVTGVLAVELFEVPDSVGSGDPGRSDVVVNELAMRPHNSGHWTIDGSVTSQFEQHLRAVLDLPLGDPRPRSDWTVMANVLGGDYPELYSTYRHVLAHDPAMKVHLYGKEVRPGRKIGHVTVCGDGGTDVLTQLRERAQHAADYIRGVVTE
ncbi:MAG: 5-(carboxyamino)imidazole ribonucleotide synthase [Actinomycetota bacterium]